MNFNKNLFVPFGDICNDATDLDTVELEVRRRHLLSLNNGIKNFFNFSRKKINKQLDIARGVQPKSFFSLNYKKKTNKVYSFDYVYFFLTSSNFFLPFLLNILASKNV